MNKTVLIADNWFKSRRHYLIDEISSRSNLNVIEVFNFDKNRKFTVIERIFYKLRLPLDLTKFNRRLVSIVEKNKIDYVIVIKGNYVKPNTLKKIKKISNCKLYSWSNDNMSKKHNSSLYYVNGLKFYDINFTVNGYQIETLKRLGAGRFVYFDKAFSKNDHFPEKLNQKFAFDVLFIGSAEKDRYEMMKYLSENGIRVNVFGNMWTNSGFKSNPNLKIHRHSLEGKNYREAISSSKITLCFLRKINDDLQTSRSFEIPACRGFMLAERTSEHTRIFKEDREAVFFSNKEELLEKTIYYLKNEKKRENIRDNGYNMILNSKYKFKYIVDLIFNS